jgi:hypothetical protein
MRTNASVPPPLRSSIRGGVAILSSLGGGGDLSSFRWIGRIKVVDSLDVAVLLAEQVVAEGNVSCGWVSGWMESTVRRSEVVE